MAVKSTTFMNDAKISVGLNGMMLLNTNRLKFLSSCEQSKPLLGRNAHPVILLL